MNLVYFAHSYREQDTRVVDFFGRLLESENCTLSLDPPSRDVNASKLERHLASSDGMVAVLTRRDDGVSPHITFEISLALKARKPLLVFVEDVLPDGLVPDRVLQRRFSRNWLVREIREQRHAVQVFRTYLGDAPAPRYQPTATRRTCVVIGDDVLAATVKDDLLSFVDGLGYTPATVSEHHLALEWDSRLSNLLAVATLCLCFVDTADPRAHYVAGATQGALVPTITLTTNPAYRVRDDLPMEYQPRIVAVSNDGAMLCASVGHEVGLFEQDFLELDDQAEVERYVAALVGLRARGQRYDEETSRVVQEVVMGDKYEVRGQIGAVGRDARADSPVFVQKWNELASDVDLEKLAAELAALRTALRTNATEPEHDRAVAEIASAEIAARSGDGASVMRHLAQGGKWALDTATSIGTGVATAALKVALGL